MLILTEVKRRVEYINNYIQQLQQNIDSKQYEQILQQLKRKKQKINNNYMTEYNPNQFMIESLKIYHDNLINYKQYVVNKIIHCLKNIHLISNKRGFKSYDVSNNCQGFISKISTGNVGAYASRIPLKLCNCQKIDYQKIILQTDYIIIKIILQQITTKIFIKNIIYIQQLNNYILICWKNQKNNNCNYIIFKFYDGGQKIIWYRCLNFAKLICQSSDRKQLFFKEDEHYHQINAKKSDKQIIEKQDKQLQYKHPLNKSTHLNIKNNKSYAFDRLKRRTEYAGRDNLFNTNPNLIVHVKNRKISQDYSLKQPLNKLPSLNKKCQHMNSIKSLDQYLQLSHSFISKKQSLKKSNEKDSINEKSQQKQKPDSKQKKTQNITNEQKQKQLTDQQKNNEQSIQSHKQIFFNQSSIHWIQQQQQDNYFDKSKIESQINHSNSKIQIDNNANNNTSNTNSNPNNNNKIINLSKDNLFQNKNQHISEVLDQAQQSPLLPCNMREMGSKLKRSKVMSSQTKLSNSQKNQQIMYQQKNNSKITTDINDSTNTNNGKNETNSYKISVIGLQNNSVQQQLVQDDQFDEEQNITQNMNSQNVSMTQTKLETKKNKTVQDEQNSKYLKSQSQISQTESQKYQLDNLRTGIVLQKCSTNGWNSHKKNIFLSNNDIQICVKNQKGTDLKKVNIANIQKIQYGTITPGITKHIKNIQKNRCMSIKCKVNNENKMLEFYLPQNQPVYLIQQFYQKLNAYFKYKISQQN